MQGDGLIALTTELIAPENKQVLAPLAFVSGLAGALLALHRLDAATKLPLPCTSGGRLVGLS